MLKHLVPYKYHVCIETSPTELNPSQLVVALQVQAGAERGHGQVVVVDGELRSGQAGEDGPAAEAEGPTRSAQVEHDGLGVHQQSEK